MKSLLGDGFICHAQPVPFFLLNSSCNFIPSEQLSVLGVSMCMGVWCQPLAMPWMGESMCLGDSDRTDRSKAI